MKALSVVLVCILFGSASASGQYYFNDILATQQTNEQYKLLRNLKIKKVSATSFEQDNTPTEGFSLEQDISMDGKKITLFAATLGGKKVTTVTQYEGGRLKRSHSNSNGIDNRTDYTYNEKGQVKQIVFTTTDTAMKMVTTELHEWSYAENGLPIGMLKIKNKTDTIQVECLLDEKKLVAEERWKKKNKGIETYYYYYNDQQKLTDIVRFNARMKKFLPDYLYEYDTNGRISQLTQVSMSSASYMIWKYTYNEKGLKSEEAGYDKEKKLVGKMVYTYE